MSNGKASFDAIVIGGGPTGATAGLVMARLGLRVLLIEKTPHPRFHIGESFLPRNRTLIEELGLADKLDALPHMVKYGAAFEMGDGQAPREFRFDRGIPVGETVAWNIERALYDAMVLSAAKEAGVDVREGVAVRDVPVLRDGHVTVQSDAGTFHASYVLDASGQQAFLGRLLKTRRVLERHQKVAYFGHFKGVARNPGDRAGYPLIVMCTEGWFWLIPIDKERTSIGLVLDAAAAKTVDAPPQQMLRWAIARSPALRERTRNAVFPTENGVCADFSYRCEPYAGPGYFLLGDAAMFVDPIFSTGVNLGMMGGKLAGEMVHKLVRGRGDADRLRRRYVSYLKSSSAEFFKLIDLYYEHSFRELFLSGEGPLKVAEAVISILGGHAFPRPAFKLWWRMRFFELVVAFNRRFPVAPPLKPFSLLEARPTEDAPFPLQPVVIAGERAGVGV